MIGGVLGGRYEPEQELDSSPIFASYRALDRQTGREARLRVLEPAFAQDPAFVRALRAHVERLHEIDHPTLERVQETVVEGQEAFLVCEFVPGTTLDERIQRLASFSIQLALSTAIQIAEALIRVHQGGMVHGDLSSRNVLLHPSGTVKLAMTGFWETYPNSPTAGLVMLKGMAPYLAPEVTAGEMPSPATDVYALGVLLYQMLAGRAPYPGDSSAAIARKHAEAAYPSLRAVNPSVPLALDELVKTCMAKSARDRYPDATRLLADLRAIQDALRFGRPLTWPIQRVEATPPRVAVPVEEPTAAPEKVPTRPARQDSDGVPAWLAAIVYSTTALVALAIGGWAFFNFNAPRLIDVPNVVGMPEAQARTSLEKAGLRLNPGGRQASEEFPVGIVLDQNPPPGRKNAKQGGSIEVTLSAGGRFIEVPDLRGRSVQESERVLASVDLKVADQVTRARSKDVPAGMVISQNPPAGKKLERGSSVRLRVSNGDEPVPGEPEPGLYTYKISLTMPIGQAKVQVRVDMTDDRETKTIYEGEHAGGETFEASADGYGREALFRVFFNGDLVSQQTQRAEVTPRP